MSVVKSDRPVNRSSLSRPPSLRSRATLYLLIFVACVLVTNSVVGERGFTEALRAKRDSRELAASIAVLRQENMMLTERARELREDLMAIEWLARGELGLIRPGEKMFIITDFLIDPDASAGADSFRWPSSDALD